ncbi:hypothetical protein CEXT_622771 [Caerostris extrusa]|uniref:Uncharacterized protein n=1 Tax=Caerostris extrusa TaxID=172846 RepID=A0AAV4Q8E0_CAEEX|nr:hypothetical protein CEXT_622771 [Caerostris extrusa]
MTTIKSSSNPNDPKDAPVYTQLIPKLHMKDIVLRNECHLLQSFFPSKISSLQQLGAFRFVISFRPFLLTQPRRCAFVQRLEFSGEVTPIMLRFVTLRNGSG